MKLYVFDWETYKNFGCVSFLEYDTDERVTFIFDENVNQRKELLAFIKEKKVLVGYNSVSFDNVILNYVMDNPRVNSADIYAIAQKIISLQRRDDGSYYREFKQYLKSDKYFPIDLIRLLFSKKLRVGLKELECSLNHHNVEELPYPFDSVLTEEQKQKVISYNINDCEATKLVLQKSMEALKLRKWMHKEYGVDAYSLDGVNGGVKILELLYAKEVKNNLFKEDRTVRESINIKDIILPIIQFETPEFNKVLNMYKKHIWYNKDYDEDAAEDNKFKYEPVINGFGFKFSLGGLHGNTKSKIWESNDEYEIMSVDVASYYPSLVLQWGFVPAHLNKESFLKIYSNVKKERLEAKANGDSLKDLTLKLSINGTYGMFGNKYSWLFDHNVRLQICVNGQLMLAMLIEKFFKENIELIDANTDGVYVYLHKSKKKKFEEIIKWWESITKMEMEQTKFEKMWFLNTADYFGTTYKKDKKTGELVLDVKPKGMFIENVQLGKGMEFPIIAKSVKKYFLENEPFENYIYKHDNILDFCSYKKLKADFQCFHGGQKQQRINRFYACKSGAYLYKRKYDEKKQRYQTDHVLKDSPVILLNKIIDMPIKNRNINYGFYISNARKIIYAIEGDKNQASLF